jgi:hypothetical protein
MNIFKNKKMRLGFIGLFMSLLTASPVMAAIATEVRANEEGLYVKYDLGLVGSSREIIIAPGEPMAEIFSIKRFITIEAAVTEKLPEENKIHISAKLSGLLFKNGAIEVHVALPFGSFGIYTSFRERQFIPLQNHDIETSLLISKKQTQYAVNINLGEFFDSHWGGGATPSDNTIHGIIVSPIDGGTVAEIDLMLQYASKFFTIILYDIALATQENELSTMEGIEQNAQDISGKILLPNGAYHIWADLDLSNME